MKRNRKNYTKNMLVKYQEYINSKAKETEKFQIFN